MASTSRTQIAAAAISLAVLWAFKLTPAGCTHPDSLNVEIARRVVVASPEICARLSSRIGGVLADDMLISPLILEMLGCGTAPAAHLPLQSQRPNADDKGSRGLEYIYSNWPTSTIAYVIDSSAALYTSAIVDAVKAISAYTNVKIVKRTTEEEYVRYTAQDIGSACGLAYVGYISPTLLESVEGKPYTGIPITFSNSTAKFYCNRVGIVLHETLHMLGFLHEHLHPLAVEQIAFDPSCIQPGFEKAFSVNVDSVHAVTKYDILSIMHYSPQTFKKQECSKVISAKDPMDEKKMGSCNFFSGCDIASVNRLFPGAKECTYSCECNIDISTVPLSMLEQLIDCDSEGYQILFQTEQTAATPPPPPLPPSLELQSEDAGSAPSALAQLCGSRQLVDMNKLQIHQFDAHDPLLFSHEFELDSKSGLCIIGTPLSDTIRGSHKSDVIFGMEGNDLVQGRGGDDTIYGGQGSDIIIGSKGNDWLAGNLGKDIVSGNTGNDIVIGNGGKDKLSGGKGSDLLLGNKGSDTLIGGRGMDAIDGGKKADVVYVCSDDVVIQGDEDNLVQVPC